MMPDIDGLAALKRMQANPARHIPVILLTAKTPPADRRQYTRLEFAAVITQPYDPPTLADQIAEILA